MKFILITLVLFFNFQTAFSQEIDIDGNWYKEIKGIDDFYTSYDFRRYTVNDVANAKKKFQSINRLPPGNEWEGIYTSSTEIGNNELHWKTEGFVYFYVYHTLANLDFGDSVNKSDSVKLISRKSLPFKIFSSELVKVKIGGKHYLVPENRLKDFAERAIGLSTSFADFGYYWFKLSELDIKTAQLPVFPSKYNHYLRLPINTKISRIGNRQIHQDKFDDKTVNYEEVYRFVTLGAGRNKNIKKGMNFFVKDLREWVEVTKVFSSSSTAKFRRGFYENKERCFEDVGGSGEITPCKEIKIGMKAETKAHYF